MIFKVQKLSVIAAAACACVVGVALIVVFIDYVEKCECDLDNNTAVNGQRHMSDISYESKKCSTYIEVVWENSAPNHQAANLPVGQFNQNPAPDSPAPQQPAVSPITCGLQPAVTSHIKDDLQTSKFAEMPWSLTLLVRARGMKAKIFKCGASLIHPQVAMTVAHCTSGREPEELTIRAGEWNTRMRNEPLPHHDRPVKEILVHPDFQPGTLWNNVALLFLLEPVTLADNVGTVCIPNSTTDLGSKCIASGWGISGFMPKPHSILKNVELPLVSLTSCSESLRKIFSGSFNNFHKSFICDDGQPINDTCPGDRGSPLVCSVEGFKNRYALVGMVCWTTECGRNGIPSVYVNVGLYRRWIDEEMAARGLNNSYYAYD